MADFKVPVSKKRGSSFLPSQPLEMNTRSMKRQRLNDELEAEPENPTRESVGASCLKYEIIRKRDKTGNEKNVLLAKRCSLRNQCLGLGEARQDIEGSFEYEPRSFEKLFVKDTLTTKVQQMALQAKMLDVSEIGESLGYLDTKKTVALIKLSAGSAIAKSTGLQRVAAHVGKHDSFKTFIQEECPEGHYLEKFMIIQASGQAKNHIRQCL